MQGEVTILLRVRGLIERLAPEPICDGCIAEKLNLTPGQANQTARELVGGDGFERQSDICAICGASRTVTRKRVR